MLSIYLYLRALGRGSRADAGPVLDSLCERGPDFETWTLCHDFGAVAQGEASLIALRAACLAEALERPLHGRPADRSIALASPRVSSRVASVEASVKARRSSQLSCLGNPSASKQQAAKRLCVSSSSNSSSSIIHGPWAGLGK